MFSGMTPLTHPTQMCLSCLIDVTHISAKNTSFVTGTGQNHREIKNETMFHALDPAKAVALTAFRVSSGAGNTGCFSGKGKALMKIAILISALYKYYYYH